MSNATKTAQTALAVVPARAGGEIATVDRTATSVQPGNAGVGEMMSTIKEAVTAMGASDITLEVTQHDDASSGRSVSTLKFRAHRRGENG